MKLSLSIIVSAFLLSVTAIPDSVDWRGKAVTSVKNQGSCGSPYAFSAVGAIESALMIKGKGEMDLSEQQLVDCTYNKLQWNFNFGCNGGDPAQTIQWALQNGLQYESNYPYTSGNTKTHGPCRASTGQVDLSSLKLGSVRANDENALAEALATYGPIAITINGENQEFYNYRGGIYNNPQCSTKINHAALLVGYGVQNGQPYWIIKNNWGSSWGENGFMKLARGYNRCGIVSWSSYYVY